MKSRLCLPKARAISSLRPRVGSLSCGARNSPPVPLPEGIEGNDIDAVASDAAGDLWLCHCHTWPDSRDKRHGQRADRYARRRRQAMPLAARGVGRTRLARLQRRQRRSPRSRRVHRVLAKRRTARRERRVHLPRRSRGGLDLHDQGPRDLRSRSFRAHLSRRHPSWRRLGGPRRRGRGHVARFRLRCRASHRS